MKTFCIFVSTMIFGAFVLTSRGDKKDTKAGDGGGDRKKEQAASAKPAGWNNMASG